MTAACDTRESTLRIDKALDRRSPDTGKSPVYDIVHIVVRNAHLKGQNEIGAWLRQSILKTIMSVQFIRCWH